MGRTLTEWRDRVFDFLGNVPVDLLPATEVDLYVVGAIRQFSHDKPRVLFADYLGDGSTFDLLLPSSWLKNFSRPQAVEYPQGERPEEFLDLKEVTLYPRNSDPTHLRLNETTPATGKTARLYYSVPWPSPDATAATDKIVDTDHEPVAKLAAAGGALQLAARAATHKRSIIPEAALVGHETEEDRWRNIARDYLKAYNEHVGVGDGGSPASGVTDWDLPPPWGKAFLFRRGRR